MLLNTHTGERLDLVVRADGVPRPEALPHIDHLLRDHRNDATHRIATGVIDQLLGMRNALELTAPFHVISAYRSPATNARLAAASNGVARDSLHLTGRAIDIRVPGLALTRLHAAALALQAGGVGFYARSDFVHLDTGRVRTSWSPATPCEPGQKLQRQRAAPTPGFRPAPQRARARYGLWVFAAS